MSVPLIQTSFVTGEVAPALFGHVDLARMKSAASTMRNMWVGYRGGAYSRGGTKFVGFSKQTGRAYPPRMIPFQFSVEQGLALEFGHQYMRVISQGAFVTETALNITGITQASPGVVSYNSGIVSATPNTLGVTASYAPTNTVTLAGGTFSVAGVLTVTNTRVVTLALNAVGVGNYAAGDVVTLAGGTASTPGQVTVLASKVVSATIVNAGAGGAPGVYAAFGTTGSGNLFQAVVTVGGGGTVTAIGAITVPGVYTANPAAPTTEPVLIPGSGVAGAVFNIVLGIESMALSNPGVYTVNPGGAAFTQASSTGTGTGATFNTVVMGPNTVSVSTPGTYTAFPSNPVSQSATSGTGAGATFDIVGSPSYANGDWVYLSGIGGMPQLNGETAIVAGAAAGSFQLHDVYGNNINTTAFGAYTAGGTVARVYTLTTSYAEQDLPYLKFTQSADVMSLCCVNQQTLTEYPTQDLVRSAAASWSLTTIDPEPSVTPPVGTPAVATSSAGAVTYQFEITAVSPQDGTESIASEIGQVASAVNIYATAGTISVSWGSVNGVSEYNVYMASPGVSTTPPAGALFGYVGTVYGTQFINSNILPDFAQVPPTHRNPFARGTITGVALSNNGAGYTTVGFTITTLTGSGAVLQGVLVSGAVAAVIVKDPGQGYLPGDTVTVTGDGAGARASLTIGAQSGTYPGVVAYFQQRRAYAFTLNNPDTYFMSQPGAFTNFDSRIPTIDTDAIVGSPWSVQVNGVQWMVATAAGLLVFTGQQAWLLVGQGSFATNVAAVSPSSQVVNPQPEVGCSPILPPIKINYDVLFVDSNSSSYYDQPYQLSSLAEPIDLTQNSPHLFTGYTFVSHAWCRRPYKLVWGVRDDGALLSLTFLKSENVAGWARHDTQGLVKSNCAVIEPPVDAHYLAVQRFPGVNTAYTIERMDNRIWFDVEDTWAVDCALSLAQPTPAATLTASSATGLGSITGITALVGGSGYTAIATAAIIDAPTAQNNGPGPGAGATATLTIVGGAITAVTITAPGAGYLNPQLVITDPAASAGGAGASARLTLNNAATFTASAATFTNPGSIGSVIRMGGGIATITGFTSTTIVTANINSPIVDLIPNTTTPQRAAAGDWTLTAPVTIISGLRHLIGASVTGLADGNVITPRTVSAAGTITLDTAASAVTVGLGFQAQLQSTYLEAGQQSTLQAARKKISAVTARIEASRGVKAGSNQPDGSVQSPPQLAPRWTNLADMTDKAVRPYNALCQPLYTGDTRCPVTGGAATFGQVAFQQDYPLPMNVLAIIDEVMPGDTPQTGRATRRDPERPGA